MDWVNFDEIKKAVSLQMLTERYGILLRRVSPNTLRGTCPLPTHKSKDSKESFIATLDKGSGGAWSCHSKSCAAAREGKRGGNALDFVATMEHCSIREAATKLAEWFAVPLGTPAGKTTTNDEDPKKSAALASKKKLETTEEKNNVLTFARQAIDHPPPYPQSRAAVEQTAPPFE